MTHPLFSVKDQVVIVTGASRGIGRAVAEGFIAADARVAFVARSEEMLSRVAQLPSDRALAIQCDVSGEHAPEEICGRTLEKFGRVDTLVNNAGVSLFGDDPYDDSLLSRTLAVNLTAIFRLSRAVSEVMKRQGKASIINIVSIASSVGLPNSPAYQAAKGGLRMLTKAMARDWTPHGIRVNNICPGFIRTDMTAGSYADPEKRKQRTDQMIIDRYGEPGELVGPCLFLASEASSYVTGADLFVDGGLTAKGL